MPCAKTESPTSTTTTVTTVTAPQPMPNTKTRSNCDHPPRSSLKSSWRACTRRLRASLRSAWQVGSFCARYRSHHPCNTQRGRLRRQRFQQQTSLAAFAGQTRRCWARRAATRFRHGLTSGNLLLRNTFRNGLTFRIRLPRNTLNELGSRHQERASSTGPLLCDRPKFSIVCIFPTQSRTSSSSRHQHHRRNGSTCIFKALHTSHQTLQALNDT